MCCVVVVARKRKQMGNVTLHINISAEWYFYDGVSYFVSSGWQPLGDRQSCWWNTSIIHIPCESASACGRKGREQTNREGRKECPKGQSCDFCFFFLFLIAAQWLHVFSLGLLASFSKPSPLSVFSGPLFCLIIQQHTFPRLFFFSFRVTCECSSCPCFMQNSSEGRTGNHGEAVIYFDLSWTRWIEGANKRSRLSFGLSVCAPGSQARKRKDVTEETPRQRETEKVTEG